MILYNFTIYKMEQCCKHFSLHMDLLIFEKKKDMVLLALQKAAWEYELGRECVGAICKGGLWGWHAAEKLPRWDGSLGYVGSVTACSK